MIAQRHDCVILGGGLCGLSTAHELETSAHEDYVVLERNDRVGGLTRTSRYDGFSFDHSIHILYPRDERVADLISNVLLKENLRRQERRSFCYSEGVYTEYPYQAHTHGLPPEVILENILGIIEARYGRDTRRPPRNFEEWVYAVFGAGIAKNFMIPYNRRVWGWDLKEMGFDWISDRVPVPSIEEVIRGAITEPREKYGRNREFWYPREGGIEALPTALQRRLPPHRVRCGTRVAGIDVAKRELRLAGGEGLGYRRLVSTVPLPSLVGLVEGVLPPAVRNAAAALKANRVHTVNIGLQGTDLDTSREMHWVYFPSEETVFHRISFPAAFSPSMAPEGCSSVQAEITESAQRDLRGADLIRETLDGLVRVGLLDARDARPVAEGGRVAVAGIITLDPAYIIYDLDHAGNVAVVRDFFAEVGIDARGRFGEWEYFNMDDAILSGIVAAQEVLAEVG